MSCLFRQLEPGLHEVHELVELIRAATEVVPSLPNEQLSDQLRRIARVAHRLGELFDELAGIVGAELERSASP